MGPRSGGSRSWLSWRRLAWFAFKCCLFLVKQRRAADFLMRLLLLLMGALVLMSPSFLWRLSLAGPPAKQQAIELATHSRAFLTSVGINERTGATSPLRARPRSRSPRPRPRRIARWAPVALVSFGFFLRARPSEIMIMIEEERAEEAGARSRVEPRL